MYNDHMKTMSVTEFKAKCLRVLDQVLKTGESVLLLKRGRAIARVAPPGDPAAIDLTPGRCAHTVSKVGDVITPVLDASELEIEKRWF